ncbi:hypothetical protein NE604_00815 [Anaerofustis stercorihominis]|uniref:hypothetical protein n=1 Tax=Anaerofustis stercorihominis TaxID=214853 RepID=UPI00210E303A|nr:hypothetical protein [Anaerofustis stercorihominis]MCQ4794185.1 hypothetical protein [Anaerofustis stercorihominis]
MKHLNFTLKNMKEKNIIIHPYISYILAAICIPSLIIAGVIISVTLVMYPLSIILGWV